MKFVVKRLRVAEEDALEAALWYDAREAGLGDDFLDEVDAAVQNLRENALIHRVRFSDVRRALVPRSSITVFTTSFGVRKSGCSPYFTGAGIHAGWNNGEKELVSRTLPSLPL